MGGMPAAAFLWLMKQRPGAKAIRWNSDFMTGFCVIYGCFHGTKIIIYIMRNVIKLAFDVIIDLLSIILADRG